MNLWPRKHSYRKEDPYNVCIHCKEAFPLEKRNLENISFFEAACTQGRLLNPWEVMTSRVNCVISDRWGDNCAKGRVWWNKLWIRKDEFHSSLNLDTDALLRLDKEGKKAYLRDLMRRRNLAHYRDLNDDT